MKTLYLVRHASASIDSPTKKDVDREINFQGINEADAMAGYMMKNKQRPELIITSNASRAKATAQIFAKHLFYPNDKIQESASLFEGKPDAYLKVISACDDGLSFVLLIGHNPAITQLANELLQKPVAAFKPSGVACIEFEIEKWNVLPAAGILKYYSDPQLIRSSSTL